MLALTAHYLKQHPGYISGENISKQLGLSRAAVWKHIHELRQQGYRIEAMPRQGYRLVSSPDKLFPWEVQAGLGTRRFGRKIHYYNTTTSTMDEASRLATGEAEEGTVVCAEAQTSGRGRMGRSWQSPKGLGIYMSVILRPDLALPELAKLTLVAAVALCEALRRVSGQDVRIKWPNDLLVDGKKLVGILTELKAEMDRANFVVLGVGINVNGTSRQLLSTATSLRALTGHPFSRVAVLQEVLRSLEYWYEIFLQQGFAPVAVGWKAQAMILGRQVRVTNAHRQTVGQAIDLADDGALLLKTATGTIEKVMSGDVALL